MVGFLIRLKNGLVKTGTSLGFIVRNPQLIMFQVVRVLLFLGVYTDLLWKVLKLYMEEIEKINLEIVSPRGVIREVVKSKLLSEAEGDLCMKMVVSCNQTSHIYHEATAAAIAQDVPGYFQVMNTTIARVAQKVV